MIKKYQHTTAATRRQERAVINASDSHYLTYPYQDLNATVQFDYTAMVERNFRIQELIAEVDGGNLHQSNFNAIVSGIRYIRDNYYLDCSSSVFIDCLGCSGSAALYSSSFKWKTVKSIEVSDESKKKARVVMLKVRDEVPNTEIILKAGSMKDYFSTDASVVYINTSFFAKDSMIDEATLLRLLFDIGEQLLPGTFIIAVTYYLKLETKNIEEDMGIRHVECLHHQQIDGDFPDKETFWVLKVRSTKSNIEVVATDMAKALNDSLDMIIGYNS